MEGDMIVYVNYHYNREKINGKKIVNGIFEIFDCIGEGAFWKVFLVKRNFEEDTNFYVFKEGQLSGDCKYNMNLLRSDEEVQQEETRRGVQEYLILEKVNHKNITRLYECIMDHEIDKCVLIMEYADLGILMNLNQTEDGYYYNQNLINFILKNCIGESEKTCIINETESISFTTHHKILILTAKFILRQLAEALEYLHERFITHRDIKPDNVSMKKSDKQIKLLDFSIAKKLSAFDDEIISETGTPAFDPPEIMQRENYNPFIGDIYLLGATIYVFLFNSINFSLEQKENLKLLYENDPQLSELITLMMNSDSKMRPTAKEILKNKIFDC